MRGILLIVLALTGCGSDTNVADMTASADLSDDLSMCMSGVTAPNAAATPCGWSLCAPGQICVEHQPGIAIPPPDFATPPDGGADGDDPYRHSCLVLPAECRRCGGCGALPGAGGPYFGCFSSICDKYETGCRFDGATLTCIGL
jgi:hypothetical protein